MSYFGDHSSSLLISESSSPNSGLRRGQVGALFALGAHFIEKTEPAIVCLPTGYGKTALITAAGFLLKSQRVLVVTPTIALRSQATKAFESFDVLRRLGCLPKTEAVPNPNIHTIQSQLTSAEEWAELENIDVAICTPHSVSPQIAGVYPPPPSLFDVIIMDEGHHSPAATWSALIAAFPNARHILFSATPFRRDRRQLPGKLVFYYPLRKAVEEKAFGRVRFSAVEVDVESVKESRDQALVNRAAEVFRLDVEKGFDHKIFARTDRTAHADDLATRYTEVGLRIKSVSSRKSKAQIDTILHELDTGALDGIVCVDMLGEGFDFPRFKIAVLHAAHNSLVPTLQFIGRFARTTDERTGDATFIAIPREVDSESEVLYRSGVDWDVLLANIAEARHELALQEREILQTFAETAKPTGDYENISPGSIRLGLHVAAYKVNKKPNFGKPPVEVKSMLVCAAWASEDGNTGLFLASDASAPEWYSADHLIDSRHECFLLRYYEDSDLLFISATDRSEQIYVDLISHFFDGDAVPLPYQTVMKVRHGLTDQEFYNVGVRNISATTTAESYRILAGKSADRGIRESDSSNYAQGHFMGRGKYNGAVVVIGASARGRMWAPGRESIPSTISWMDSLRERITAKNVSLGRSGLDLLIYGQEIDKIPLSTCMADWSETTYVDCPIIRFMQSGHAPSTRHILDLEIGNFSVSADALSLSFDIGDGVFSIPVVFRIDQSPFFLVAEHSTAVSVVLPEGETISFDEWLNGNPIRFFTKELDSFEGGMLWKRAVRTEIRSESLIAESWTDCEITVEFDVKNPMRPTVQKVLQDKLMLEPNNSFIIYDHRSGEAADFIVGKALSTNELEISLYHCKGAGGKPSGERVDDVYELAGQSVKSSRFQIKEALIQHIERRTTAKIKGGHSPFLLSDLASTSKLIEKYEPIDIKLQVFAVQPGLSKGKLTDNVRKIMVAANVSLSSQRVSLKWMISP